MRGERDPARCGGLLRRGTRPPTPLIVAYIDFFDRAVQALEDEADIEAAAAARREGATVSHDALMRELALDAVAAPGLANRPASGPFRSLGIGTRRMIACTRPRVATVVDPGEDRCMRAVVADMEETIAEKGSLLTRVPGRARPRAVALEEFEQAVAELKQRCKPVLWPLLVPQAVDMYRWRMQLECGCVSEVWTRGEEKFPDDNRKAEPITRTLLPQGEALCCTDHGDRGPHYRDITEWVEREEKEFPAGPEEPQHGLDAEVWATLRHSEPHSSAFWRVRLACGHIHDHVVTDVEWMPEDGPKLVTEERAAEMLRECQAYWPESDVDGWAAEGQARVRWLHLIDQRWPRPEPDRDCRTCRSSRRITGYQRIGWLVPRAATVAPNPDANRRKVEARLAKAEAEVRQMRKQLGLNAPEAEG